MASLHSPPIPLSPSTSKPSTRIPNFPTTKLLSAPYSHSLKRRLYHHSANLPGPHNSAICRCKNANSSEDDIRWDLLFQDALRGAAKRCQEYLSSYWNSLSKEVKDEVVSDKLVSAGSELGVKDGEEIDEWNWERWKKHFEETQESESLFSALKVQLRAAIAREDYRSAERFRQAIATAGKYDAVGKALSDLNSAIEEERFTDASYIRDNAGAGLIGWWAGVSENKSDPHGLIVRITAEYGRYVAKSYNSRQLTSSSPGWPLFEVYFTEKDGQFKQQAVYINPASSKKSGEFSSFPLDKTMNILKLLGGKSGGTISDELNLEEEEEEKDESDLDILDLSPDNNNIALPPFGFKILKVSSGGKIDRGDIAKIIDQILEEEIELEIEEEDENEDDDQEEQESEDEGIEDIEEIDEENEEGFSKMAIDFDISEEFEVELETDNDDGDNNKTFEGESGKLPGFTQVAARLEQKGRYSFTLHLEKDENEKEKKSGTQEIKKKKKDVSSLLKGSDLDLNIGKKKVFVQIIAPGIKNLLSQYKTKQRLSGSTHFRRIMTPVSSDPLTGLYISASGMDNEILCLQRKFGQWKNEKNDDYMKGKNTNFEFYEYVEAVKLIGGHLAPAAGQVMFRAKVGKQHQLPHDGLIPKELGVIGRYKGQGKVPEPGSKKTQWVDGELVILDGKFINNGPMIGFFYWSTKLHFFEFFARLNLPD